MAKMYTQHAVDTAVNEILIPSGYEVEVLESTLVDGYICEHPDDDWKLVIFLPVFINEWSSGLEMHQYRDWSTVPKSIKKVIDMYREENDK